MDRPTHNADTVGSELKLPPEWIAQLRTRWGTLADLAVWGELGATQLGALPRVRKRVLDLGEKLAALDAPRAWIPRARERLKHALAAALAAQDSLAHCEQACAQLDRGVDREALAARLQALRGTLEPALEQHAQRWAQLLDADAAATPNE